MYNTVEKLLEELKDYKIEYFKYKSKLDILKKSIADKLLVEKSMSIDSDLQSEYDDIVFNIGFAERQFEECKIQIKKRIDNMRIHE